MFSGAIKSGKAAAASPTPPATNPPFNYVTTLVHGDGTNGQNNYSYVDSVTPSPLTITTIGTQQSQSAFNPYKSAYSVDCRPAQTPIFTIPFNTVFAMGTGTFTMECWVYPYSYGTIRGIVDIYDSNSAGRMALRLTTTGAVQLAGGAALATNIVTTTGTLTLNVWSHIAVVRSGTGSGQVVVYINGVADATTGTSATSFTNTVGNVHLCCDAGTTGTATPANYFDGLISQLRIVKAVAVYTGTFTVPTSVLTSTQSANPYGGSNTAAITGTNTSLLTFVRPYIVNISANTLTMYRGAAAASTSYYPWFVSQIPIPNATISAPTTAVGYTSASFSGSYANTVASSTIELIASSAVSQFVFGTSNYTLEGWFYIVNTVTTRNDLFNFEGGNRLALFFDSTTSGRLSVFQNAAVPNGIITSLITAFHVAGTWSHIALVRTSTTLTTLYVNGVSVGTATTNYNLSAANVPWQLGVDQTVVGYAAGYRVVKGTAIYTAAFTPPTSPVTQVTNTTLLLNFSTAGMYDSSMNQMLIPQGTGVVLSTTQSKFGGSSIRFPGGITNYITTQNFINNDNQAILLGSGDFTVEGWFYADAATSDKGIFQIAFTAAGFGAQTGLALAYYTSNNLRLFYGAASAATGTASTVTTAAWIHFAVVRYGTGASNLTVYIDGVADSALIVTDSYNYPSAYLTMGGYNTTARTFTGYLDEFRISKYAVYTSNFTPPTAAFPDL